MLNGGMIMSTRRRIDRYGLGLEEQDEDLYWSVVAIRETLEWKKAGKPVLSFDDVEHILHKS